MWLDSHMVTMIKNIDLSREILAIDILTALKSFLEQRGKRFQRSL